MPTSILFVTAFIKIYNDGTPNNRTHQWRIDHFTELSKTGIDILLFISPEFVHLFEQQQHYKNIRTIVIDAFRELPLFNTNWDNTKLPEIRNHEKDTKNYLLLMNSKPEFMRRAIMAYPNYALYSWIDFNINYIFREPQQTLSFLAILPYMNWNTTNTILTIPGCWPKQQDPIDTNAINWRLCGGFFIATKAGIQTLYKSIYSNIDKLLQNGLVWETNYWAMLEQNNQLLIDWYRVQTHNDEMVLKIPTNHYITPLRWHSISNLPFGNLNGWYATSTTFAETPDSRLWLITRLINYRLTPDGRTYIFPDNNYQIKNRNILTEIDHDHTPISQKELTFNDTIQQENQMSIGLEDIRLYPNMRFSASQCIDGFPQILYGTIDPLKGCVVSAEHIKTGKCEKNWIWFPAPYQNCVLYSWNPYTIANADNNGFVTIRQQKLSPEWLFQNMRGSTPFCVYRPDPKYYVGTVHFSMDQPQDVPMARYYYHCLVLIEQETQTPLWITAPFRFSDGHQHGIEFCIGMRCTADKMWFWVSHMDANPKCYCIDVDVPQFSICVDVQK